MPRLKLLALLLFLFTHLSVASGTELENKQNEFSEVSGKIQVLKSSLSQDQNLISDSESQLKLIELELNNLGQLTQHINQKLAVEQTAIAKLKVLQDDYLAQLEKHRAALAQQIRIIYQLGQAQSVKTILNHDSLNNINRHLYYSHYLNDHRLQLMAETKQILNTLNLNMKAASEHKAKLKILLRAKQTELNKQLLAKNHRQKILLQLQQKTLSHQHQLAGLENVLRAL